jgi:cytochrome P450
LEAVVNSLPNELSVDEINKHSELTHFIKEASRIYPPSFDLFPRYNKEPVTLGGETFEKNTYFGLSVKTIMNDPLNFHEPEKFMPERW